MAISRGGMGKELTGGRQPRKFATGGATTSTPKTATFSTSPASGTPSITASKAPTYSGFSVKGLTSNDPANVARNRAAAAGYAASSANRGGSGNGNNGSMLGGGAGAAASKQNMMMTRTYNAPPAGYDAAKNGEWNYYTYKQTAVPASGPTAKGATSGKTPFQNALANGNMGPAILGAMVQNARSQGAGNGTVSMKAGGQVKASKPPAMRGCGCAKRGTSSKGNI